MFDRCPQLQMFRIAGALLTQFADITAHAVRENRYVNLYMSNNPWHCNLSMAWLATKASLSQDRPDSRVYNNTHTIYHVIDAQSMKCHTPPWLRNNTIVDLGKFKNSGPWARPTKHRICKLERIPMERLHWNSIEFANSMLC